MGFLKIALFMGVIYLIFFSKKSPAQSLGRSLGRFIRGLREGMQETGEPPVTKLHVDAEIQDAKVLRKDIRE